MSDAKHEAGRLTVSEYGSLMIGMRILKLLSTLSNAPRDRAEALANAAHLADCWNAHEPGGIVAKLVEALGGLLDFPLGNEQRVAANAALAASKGESK